MMISPRARLAANGRVLLITLIEESEDIPDGQICTYYAPPLGVFQRGSLPTS